jgi:hypothetical protein
MLLRNFYFTFVVLFNNNKSNAMPKEIINNKITVKTISEQLKTQCKYLIKGEEKRQIASQLGVSVALVNYVIAGDRKNQKVIDALEQKVSIKLQELDTKNN